MAQKDNFQKEVVEALQKNGFATLLAHNQHKQFIQMIAATFFTNQLQYDGIADYLADVIDSQQQRNKIAQIIRDIKVSKIQKKQFLHTKNNMINRSLNKSFQKSNQIVLKQLGWQSSDSKLKSLHFTVKLLQGQKNAKHERLTLSIQIVSQHNNIKYFKQFKTSDLPLEAITIFSDVQNLFQYIQQYYKESNRIIFNPDQSMFIIVNIVIMKSKQIKQEILLNLNKEKYVQPMNTSKSNSFLGSQMSLEESGISNSHSKMRLQQSKLIVQSLIKQNNLNLETKLETLTQFISTFVNQIKLLKNQNKVLSTAINSCNASILKLQKQKTTIQQKLLNLQQKNVIKILSSPVNVTQQRVQNVQKQVQNNKWHIDQLNISLQNTKQQLGEIRSLKNKIQQMQRRQPKTDHTPLFQQLRKQFFVLNNKYLSLKQYYSRLGQKIHLTLDLQANKYLNNFRIIQNIIQKIDGDQQRHQILAKQNLSILDLKRKSHFQIKIISSVSSGVVVGIVGDNRKSERYSYDKKQCVCYDGKGFIFQQGQKVKMACKFDNGQTIRVVIDPNEHIIHWYIGYTQIGSTFIPQSLRKIKIVPYIQLYDINDKIAING